MIEYQKLQEEIRSTVFYHQPITSLKAFMSIKEDNPEWNRVLPPLVTLQDPSNNKTIISLLEFTKKMDILLSNS